MQLKGTPSKQYRRVGTPRTFLTWLVGQPRDRRFDPYDVDT